ncbi:hypothetical protein SDC9_119392 [bioreactor metagenome]|uniref:Uncharacterized protein n=1 Tax=bioreactor metagenome TaxID=1076179 RepID=A0A645C3M9_9ZZZZ
MNTAVINGRSVVQHGLTCFVVNLVVGNDQLNGLQCGNGLTINNTFFGKFQTLFTASADYAESDGSHAGAAEMTNGVHGSFGSVSFFTDHAVSRNFQITADNITCHGATEAKFVFLAAGRPARSSFGYDHCTDDFATFFINTTGAGHNIDHCIVRVGDEAFATVNNKTFFSFFNGCVLVAEIRSSGRFSH